MRFLAIALGVLAVLAPSARADDGSLELRWHLDDVAAGETFDSSGAGRDGAVAAGTLSPGRFASGLTGPRVTATVPQSQLVTLSAWVRNSGVPFGQPWVVSNGGRSGCVAGVPAAYGLKVGGDGAVTFRTSTAGGEAVSAGAGPIGLWDGQWHHLLGTYDSGNELRLYLDGAAVGSPVAAGPIDYTGATQPFDLGGYASGCPDQAAYSGDADEVRLYRTALGAAEIAHLGSASAVRAPVLPIPPASDAVSAQYHLDGDATDSSGNGLDANLVSAGNTPGRYGGAFSLTNAGDGFLVTNDQRLQPQELTVSAWVNAATNPGGFRTIVGKGSDGCSPQSWALHTDAAGNVDFYVSAYNQQGGRTFAQTAGFPAASVWDGQWHALTGTYRNGVVELWVDGVRRFTGSIPAADVGPGGPEEIDYERYTQSTELSVGRYSAGPAQGCDLNGFQYRGAIDEVRLYDRRLSAGQIGALHDPSVPAPPDVTEPPDSASGDLRLRWDLDAGGPAIDDSSPNELDGTATDTTPIGDGRFGGAHHVATPGDGLITRAGDPRLEPGRVTLAFWTRGTSSPEGHFLAAYGNCADVAYGFQGESTGVRWNLARPVIPYHELFDGRWHLVVGTYDGTRGRVYLDGGRLTETANPGDPPPTLSYGAGPQTFTVGRQAPGCGQGAGSDLDDVRVYGRALTGAEVAHLARTRHPEPPALPVPPADPGDVGLLVQYHLDTLYTRFDGDLLLADSSGSDLTATDGAGEIEPAGRFGRAFALPFNRTGAYARDPGGLLAPPNVTALLWMKPGGPGLVLSKGIGPEICDRGAYGFDERASTVVFYVRLAGGLVEVPVPLADVSDGGWHALAGAYDGATVAVWRDGVKIAEAAAAGGIDYTGLTGDSLLIGRHFDDDCGQWNGILDELRIYDRKLSAEELEYVMDPAATEPRDLPKPVPPPTPEPEPGLALKWHLDPPDIGALPVPDHSGNNLHGTIDGATSIGSARFRGGYEIVEPGSSARTGLGRAGGPLLEPAQLTVLGWFRRDTLTSGGVIVGYGGAGCGELDYGISLTPDDLLTFTVETEPDSPDTTPVARITDTQWHFVAGTFDGDRARLYVDGAPVGDGVETSASTIFYAPDGRFQVGDAAQRPCPQFIPLDGDVDEIRLYDRALNGDEIAYLAAGFHRRPPVLPRPPGPRNQVPPTFTATPLVGRVVRCNPGTWTGNPTLTYLWERAPRPVTVPGDAAWVAIDGAVGQEYTLAEADDGSRVRCREIATNGDGLEEAVSNSKRVDSQLPAPNEIPTIEGLPAIAGQQLSCDHGDWDGNPEEADFRYRWTRDNQTTVGTGRTYVPTPSRFLAEGDANHDLRCHVTASNDVGISFAEAASTPAFVIEGPPYMDDIDSVNVTIEGDSANPLAQTAVCNRGRWYDDYASHPGSAPVGYEDTFQWYRRVVGSDEVTAIPGAVGRTFQLTPDVLGRNLKCYITVRNALGDTVQVSPDTFIPLPAVGSVPGRMQWVFRNNRYDPMNVMATTNAYSSLLSEFHFGLMLTEVAKIRTACGTAQGRANERQPAPRTYAEASPEAQPLTPAQQCWVLNRSGNDQFVYSPPNADLYWREQGCFAGVDPGDGRFCHSFGLQTPRVDASNTTVALTAEQQAKLAPHTPLRVLWDIDDDGATDLVCPGSSPVLRGNFPVGVYSPTAVIILPDSATTGSFAVIKPEGSTQVFAFPNSEARTQGTKRRPLQPMWCRNTITPPPDPELGPCASTGTIGGAQITGNLCPINVRGVDDGAFAGLPDDVQALIRSAADVVNKAEEAREKAQPGYHPGFRQLPLNVPPLPLPEDRNFARTAYNTAAAQSGMSSAYATAQAGGTALEKQIDELKGAKGQLAFDQIYSAPGTMKVNGVNIEQVGKFPTLVIPSDVGEVLPSVRQMTVIQKDAEAALGKLPIQEAEKEFRQTFDDAISRGDKLIKESIDIDTLAKKAESLFNLGPFKLTGSQAKVKLNDDGTATLKANATLPGLKTSEKAPEEESGHGLISIGVDILADLNGNLRLQGLEIDVGEAWMFGIHLKKFHLTYDSKRLRARGQLTFDFLGGAGIDIVSFGITTAGELEELVINYLAGAGTGIPLGASGIFMTKVGGGFTAPDPISLKGNAAFSMLSPAAKEGCPTIGVDGGVSMRISPTPIELTANVDVVLVCIKLADIDLFASTRGIARLDANMSVSVPAIVDIRGHIGGQVQTRPNLWQIDASGAVDFKFIPIDVELKGVVSNVGMAACGRAKIGLPWPFDDLVLAAGAAVRFIGGIPPLTPIQLVAGFRAFIGCDLGAYSPIRAVRSSRQATAPQQFPLDSESAALSLEGLGDAPLVTLVSPSGKRFDYSTGAAEGKFMEGAFGAVLPTEDRTVIMLREPERGMWTAEVAAGSAPIVKIQKAPVLPAPKITARVRGKGAKRVLRYRIKPIAGQLVRLFEVADNGRRLIKLVKRGGRGKVRYTVSEADGQARRVEAEVIQDELPRTKFVVARYRAPNPKVSRPRVRLRRKGAAATVRWSKVALADHYTAVATWADGRSRGFTTKARTLTLPSVGAKGGIVVRVYATSPAGRDGRAGVAKLKQKKAKKRKKKKRKKG